MSVSNVVLANFSLSSPGLAGSLVLWPKGMLVPGVQHQGSTAPRRLYLTDVKFLVPAQTLQEYLRFFHNTTAPVYTVRSCCMLLTGAMSEGTGNILAAVAVMEQWATAVAKLAEDSTAHMVSADVSRTGLHGLQLLPMFECGNTWSSSCRDSSVVECEQEQL